MRKNIILIIAALVFAATSINAQVVEEWVVWYDGPVSSTDYVRAMTVDDAGNVYVTGYSEGSGTGQDYATVKYSSSGEEEWVVRYDGDAPANDEDGARAIAIDDAGNVYVTGHSEGSETFQDYATVKYSPSGDEEWAVRYDGPVSDGDYATAIAVDGSGNVYVTGQSYGGSGTFNDYATVKYSSSGDRQWAVRYDGQKNNHDEARAIAVDNTGNVYVTGHDYGSETYSDYATVKYDSLGDEQWADSYNGPGAGTDIISAMTIDDAGNVYVTGSSEGSGTVEDYATIKYNSSGDREWVVGYNGPASSNDYARAITIDDAGNVYVTGESYGGSETGLDYATVKYDSLGDEQWVVRYNGQASGEDEALAIAVDDAGNVYVTGHSEGSGTFNDYATVKYDSSGVEQWVVRYNGQASGEDEAIAIGVDDAGNVYVTGSSERSGTGYDYATVKYDQTTGVAEEPEPSLFTVSASLNRLSYELPGSVTGLLSVYSADGRKVVSETVKGMGVWEAPAELTQGVYFCRMKAGSFTETGKLILIR